MYVYAITNPENIDKLKTVIGEEFDRLLKDGVTEQELADAKQGYLQAQKVSRADDSELSQTIAENLHYDRTMDYYADLEKKINALTPQQVVEALRKHVDRDTFVTVVAGDFAGVGTGGKEPTAEPVK